MTPIVKAYIEAVKANDFDAQETILDGVEDRYDWPTIRDVIDALHKHYSEQAAKAAAYDAVLAELKAENAEGGDDVH